MNAALQQICSCRWLEEVRISHDTHCPVHGAEYDAQRQRDRAYGEVLACQEALRDIDADIAVLNKRRERVSARMLAAQKQMEQA